jgi:hypothetical protein
MKRKVQIPILLVSFGEGTLESPDERLLVAEKITPQEVISRRGQMGSDTEIAIVDINNVDRRDVIVAALFIRNAGRTPIVCDLQHIPIDLIEDTHKFILRAKSDGKSVRTETLLTEEAMDRLGDVSDIIAYFEKEFIAN